MSCKGSEVNTFLLFQIGPVDNAKVVQDKITGQSLCYGFVKFKLAQDAKRAVDTFNGQFVGPKKLKVKFVHALKS